MIILFLTTQLPYPPISGGVIKSWKLVKHLSSKGNEIRIICPFKNDDLKNLDDFKTALPQLKIFGAALNKSRSPFNLVKSYLTSDTLNVYRNFHPDLRKKADVWIEDSDLIIVDHYEMGQYVSDNHGYKTILHQHNAEYIMWKRLAEIEKNPFKKLLIHVEASRIRRTEKLYSQRSAMIWAAPNDIEELSKIGLNREKFRVTYHLGDDTMLSLPDLNFNETEKSILFIGTLTWEANVDGLLWFIVNVWPNLLELHSDLKFYIVGKDPDARLLEVCKEYSKNIVVTGFVEDLEPYYQKSRVFVIPLRFGSGIKVKLINALYRGIPSVTTPVGSEGLNANDAVHLFESSDAEQQVEKINQLLTDKEVWINMRDNARIIGEKFTWKELLKKHDEEIELIIGNQAVEDDDSSNV